MPIKLSSFFKASKVIKRFLICSLLFFTYSSFSSYVFAESCWIGGASLGLGTANAQGSSTVSTDVTVSCNSNWSQPITYKMCLVIDSENPAGNNPRSMISYDSYPAPLLNYELFYDAAHANKLPDSELKHQAQCQTFQVSADAGNQSNLIKIYGKVLSGQNVPAGYYKTNNATLRLYYSSKYGDQAPSDYEALQSQTIATNYFLVNSNYENSCLIQSSADIDFGAVEQLNTSLFRSGVIQLACPMGTSMQVSLDNGMNAQGIQRRMRNSLGNYIDYELYRDPSFSETWQGNAFYPVEDQSVHVYAKVPTQAIGSVGQYSDIITVTLAY
ncbi:Csu type fimbrial protein [Acinetobacter baumannii]|uniref:Csu type fimbrial protein n=1 Tax=Acinetobacter baumannii TaxID=470 RepID=UPI000D68BB0D|nr:spore coat U domain-containing protein [Acinetobacter baumannii]